MPDIKPDLLKNFYEDEGTREAVREFLYAHLDKLGLEKVYAKEDTHGIADAHEAIETAFHELEVNFEKQPKKKDILNEAR